jgi:hypothetical protein
MRDVNSVVFGQAGIIFESHADQAFVEFVTARRISSPAIVTEHHDNAPLNQACGQAMTDSRIMVHPKASSRYRRLRSDRQTSWKASRQADHVAAPSAEAAK